MEIKRLKKVMLFLGIVVAVIIVGAIFSQEKKQKKDHKEFLLSVRSAISIQIDSGIVEVTTHTVPVLSVDENSQVYIYSIGKFMMNGDTVFFGHFRQELGFLRQMTQLEAEKVYKRLDVVGSGP